VRIILVTGKGGVGKTTLAAATAIGASRRGTRTLLVSTDAAPSVADVLAADLGPEPREITDRLHGLQLDGRRELQRSWGAISDYVHEALGWSDLDRLPLEELMVVPGLDQLVALARLRALADDGRWDAMVVDCAPSADSLRLLTLPDVLAWYSERIFGPKGSVNSWMRRRMARTLSVPVPGDELVDSVNGLASELSGLRSLLRESATTARIVVTPERVVVAEAQRTLTYLALYGYATDAVLINRVAGADFASAGLDPWLAAEREQLEAIDGAFSPLPMARVARRMAEPIGMDALLGVAAELYGEADPLATMADQPALEVDTSGDESRVRLLAPGISCSEIALERTRDALVVTAGEHRRVVPLPDTLCDRAVVRAGRDGAYIEVVFGEAVNA
jgi:arsenite-transporting ATPase